MIPLQGYPACSVDVLRQARDGGVRNLGAMSRFSGMGPEKKRAWGIGVVVFFLVMCAMIGLAQWCAYQNVTKYQAQSHP